MNPIVEMLSALFGVNVISFLLGHSGAQLTRSPTVILDRSPELDPGNFSLNQIPSVALMFQMRRQLSTNHVWERWLRDSFDWIYAQGLEESHVTPMQNSTILRTYVNYSPSFRHDAVREFLPPTMKHALVDGPPDCVWDDLTPCNYRLFLEAFTKFPEAQYFILISHNSIPLKPFSYMFEALKTDRRIRTTVIDFDFADGLPKTTSWRAEPREVVELRISDPYWLNSTWPHSKKGWCGPDECTIWKPLVSSFPTSFSEKFALAPCIDHKACFTFDCWSGQKGCKHSGETDSTSPFHWKKINEEFLLEQLKDPNKWFLRKVEDETPIGDDHIPTHKYLAKYFDSNYQDLILPVHPAANEKIPKKTHSNLYEHRELYKKAKLYGLRDDI
eukprot:Gregarina_sp_Pseudo_9__81@NODE_1054_length_1919_cov_11_224468_g986_i0_p1_GENE_NODE_1054_length_1919_cov_11_224468_g986_i0NODE_1054_length_1919_cov_11_224468_g986_i0_p1_ORF_typecomplete_len387_score9_41Branch/PF02485_21/6_7e07_NODE_1054_length_1919_cov_11_224468_g986_i06281788